ncbi:MAG: DUF4238 domain-containing protein [Gammaproteobacteria bacterium]|nr:DUF4238 domain-containing protein [Gammaproteobacteria bacterium]
MTGKRQHYIPQFLQRGFNSRGHDETPRAWLYRRGDAAPSEDTLRNISVEDWFYRYRTARVDISADESITGAERHRLAPLVRRLRTSKDGAISEEDRAGLAELLVHIHARTKAVWEIARSQAPPMFERLGRFARDQTAIRDTLPRLMEAHRDTVIRLLALRYPDRDIGKLMYEWMAQIETVPPDDFRSAVDGMLGGLLMLAVDALQANKVQVMRELSERPEVARRFQDCTFSVKRWGGARLVQGDTPVVFHKASGFIPVLAKDEPFEYAFLPITPTRVVVASTSGSMPESWEVLRDASIACSYRHFIAATPYPELEALSVTLGTGFPVVTGADIERLFAEAVELACTPSWMGPAEVAAVERLVMEYLGRPQGGSVTSSGGEE